MTARTVDSAALLAKRQMPDLAEARRRMVENLSRDEANAQPVLEAMSVVPRHTFAPIQFWRLGYAEMELWAPGMFLSRPSAVARIGSELFNRNANKILIYAAWAGYEASVFSLLCETVDTVEHNPWLLWAAADAFRELKLENIHQKASDGQLGWPERAPYDAIIFGASIPTVPPGLWQQVAADGIIIAPIGQYGGLQRIFLAERNSPLRARDLGPCLYPPLTGIWQPAFQNISSSLSPEAADYSFSLEGLAARSFSPRMEGASRSTEDVSGAAAANGDEEADDNVDEGRTDDTP